MVVLLLQRNAVVASLSPAALEAALRGLWVAAQGRRPAVAVEQEELSREPPLLQRMPMQQVPLVVAHQPPSMERKPLGKIPGHVALQVELAVDGSEVGGRRSCCKMQPLTFHPSRRCGPYRNPVVVR